MSDRGQSSSATSWLGKSMPRVEDPKFLLGKGRYIDDLALPDMLHAVIIPSPHAHATIVSIDTSAALAMPGVVRVLTGGEAATVFGPLPDLGPYPEKHIWRAIAAEKVRYVGEPVAVIVAASRALAEDARQAVKVDYAPLPPIGTLEQALDNDSVPIHEDLGTNRVFERALSWGDVDEVFESADHVVRDRLRWRRSGAQPMETVGAIADYDSATGAMRIHTNSLTFSNFLFMLAETLGLQSNQLQVLPAPAGGSFGSKTWAVKVAALAGMMSKLCARPVKFVEDRFDNISNCDHHGSDRLYDAALAFSDNGELLGLQIDVVDDYGAYLQYGVGTHANALSQVVGPYRIAHVSYQLTAVLTNKCQQGACRGFGSEVHNWVLERMVDMAAAKLKMDRFEIRRKNFIPSSAFPYRIPFGNEYDSGDYFAVLDKAISMLDIAAWRKKAATENRFIGVGVCTANERSGFAGTELGLLIDQPMRVTSMPESVNISVDAVGGVTVSLFSGAFTGNSAETVVTQLLADELGVNPTDIVVRYAGSHAGYPGTGPAGSRFTIMVAGAINQAAEIIRKKAITVAAALMELPLEDVYWDAGFVRSKQNPNEAKSLIEIAAMTQLFKHNLPIDISTGLEASAVFDHPHMTLPKGDGKDFGIFFPFVGHGCHIAVVEVDPDLGSVSILDYVAVHDNGTVVNPRSLEGQIRGGTAHGIGTTLMEEYVYSDNGELMTRNYHHYAIPTSMDIPEIKVAHLETPSPFTPHGIKGGGEAGRLMAPAAISSAIDDALSAYHVRVNEIPATPERIAGWIQGENAKA
ncbi:MAG: xanthine dehydrogenase family protein molybdopterin-binding subunit [Pseudomonadota bacterium]